MAPIHPWHMRRMQAQAAAKANNEMPRERTGPTECTSTSESPADTDSDDAFLLRGARVPRRQTSLGLNRSQLRLDYSNNLVQRNTFLEFPLERPQLIRRVHSAPLLDALGYKNQQKLDADDSDMAANLSPKWLRTPSLSPNGSRCATPEPRNHAFSGEWSRTPSVSPSPQRERQRERSHQTLATDPLDVMNHLVGTVEVPTMGSRGHHLRHCKPCAFMWAPEGCGSGRNCEFCHLCELGEKKRRQKEKKANIKAHRQQLGMSGPQWLNRSPHHGSRLKR